MKNRAAWNLFGELLMMRVRDRSIRDSDMIISGSAKGATAERVREILASLDEEQLQSLHEIVPEIVDITLHYLLWMFEEEERLEIVVRTDTEVVPSLRETGYGGLHGDLYDWIPQFSKQRYKPK